MATGREYDRQNAAISRATNRNRAMDAAEQRRIAASLAQSGREDANYFRIAREQAGETAGWEAIRHLRNRNYTLAEIAEAMGIDENALAQNYRRHKAKAVRVD